jgi:hypothetical protein
MSQRQPSFQLTEASREDFLSHQSGTLFTEPPDTSLIKAVSSSWQAARGSPTPQLLPLVIYEKPYPFARLWGNERMPRSPDVRAVRSRLSPLALRPAVWYRPTAARRWVLFDRNPHCHLRRVRTARQGDYCRPGKWKKTPAPGRSYRSNGCTSRAYRLSLWLASHFF